VKKLLVLLAALVALSAVFSTPYPTYAGGSPLGQMKAQVVTFRTSKAAAVLGSTDTDSTKITMNGALQTLDTSLVMFTSNWDIFSMAQSITTTPYDMGRIVFNTTGTATSVDSLFYTTDITYDGGQNWVAGTEQSILATNSGDEPVVGRLIGDSDAASNAAGHLWGATAFRVRTRPDGNTGALYPSASLTIYYWPISP